MLQPISAQDAIRWGERNIFVTHDVFVAESPGVNAEGWRMVFQSRTFLVRGVQAPLERGDLYRLSVEEVRNDG